MTRLVKMNGLPAILALAVSCGTGRNIASGGEPVAYRYHGGCAVGFLQPHCEVPRSCEAPRFCVVPQAVIFCPPARPAVRPVANVGTAKLATLSDADIARMICELRIRNGKLLDDITARLASVVEAAAASREPGSPAAARQFLDVVRLGVSNDNLSSKDLGNLIEGLNGIVPNDAEPNDVAAIVGQVAVNQQVIAWLGRARRDATQIPAGPDAPVALVPGLPQGLIVPLGFGPTLIGLGNCGDRIILGQGNVLQAAGLPAPVGPPVPDDDGVECPATGHRCSPTNPFGQRRSPTAPAVTLENVNDFDFHFAIDNQLHVLPAGRTAELIGAVPAVIRFENGDGRVKQKRLPDGTYHVAVSSDGSLDLYPAAAVLPPAQTEALVAAASRSNTPARFASNTTASVVPAPVVAARVVGALAVTAPPAPLAFSEAKPSLAAASPPSTAAVAPVAATPAAASPPAEATVAKVTPAEASTDIQLPPGFRPLDPVVLLKAAREKKTAPEEPFTLVAETNPAATAGD